MQKLIDVGLMANHLPVHHAVIKRLELYLKVVENQQIAEVIEKQVGMMNNHVRTMNQLLSPNQNQVTLPPLPSSNRQKQDNGVNAFTLNMTEKDIVIDCHFTASSMAKENFISAESMKDKQVKNIHSEMAQQQSKIGEMFAMIMEQMGWMNHPNASVEERSSVISPLQSMPDPASMQMRQQVNPLDLIQ